MTKTCNVCAEEKELDMFIRSRGWVTGLCKSCNAAKAKQWRDEKRSLGINVADNDGRRASNERYSKSEKCKAYRREWQRKRRMEDPLVRMANCVRTRVKKYLKGLKSQGTNSLVGCSWEELKLHLENQFTEGMTWENQGEWHIDHKIPLASANSLSEIEKLCHFSNLQPLWAIDNLKKGAKIL